MLEKLLLFATRSLRMFGFASVGVIFAVYLHELGLSDQRIGMLLTLTLLGDSVISLAITIVADKVGKWWMQLLGCMLVLLAGLIFASPLSQNFWLLTTAATIGVVSPSGIEVGPFQVRQVSHACPALSVADGQETCAAGLGAVKACRACCTCS